MIFEDFSSAVINKQQDFYSVKQQLKEKGIIFAMLDAIYILDHGLPRYFSHYKMLSDKAELKNCSWNVSVIHNPITSKKKIELPKKGPIDLAMLQETNLSRDEHSKLSVTG